MNKKKVRLSALNEGSDFNFSDLQRELINSNRTNENPYDPLTKEVMGRYPFINKETLNSVSGRLGDKEKNLLAYNKLARILNEELNLPEPGIYGMKDKTARELGIERYYDPPMVTSGEISKELLERAKNTGIENATIGAFYNPETDAIQFNDKVINSTDAPGIVMHELMHKADEYNLGGSGHGKILQDDPNKISHFNTSGINSNVDLLASLRAQKEAEMGFAPKNETVAAMPWIKNVVPFSSNILSSPYSNYERELTKPDSYYKTEDESISEKIKNRIKALFE